MGLVDSPAVLQHPVREVQADSLNAPRDQSPRPGSGPAPQLEQQIAGFGVQEVEVVVRPSLRAPEPVSLPQKLLMLTLVGIGLAVPPGPGGLPAGGGIDGDSPRITLD